MWSCFHDQINSQLCANLARDHFVILDNAFPTELAAKLLSEMKFLLDNDLMLPNKTQFSLPDGSSAQFTKPNIFELDLHHENIRKQIPVFDSLFHQEHLVRSFDQHLPELGLIPGTNGHTVKLQINKGHGGCFPLHYDNPGKPNKRQLTCLLYLNEHWKQGDGGEAVLVPFLKPEIIIPPLYNRLVVFYSDRVLHRVLPAVAQRFCFTIWISGNHTNSDEDVLLKMKHLDLSSDVAFQQCVSMFQSSPLQRMLSRAVYAEEYEESLRQCMEGADGFEPMHAAHVKHLVETQKTAALLEFVQRCRSLIRVRKVLEAAAPPLQEEEVDGEFGELF